jgi:hypothetical protein
MSYVYVKYPLVLLNFKIPFLNIVTSLYIYIGFVSALLIVQICRLNFYKWKI